MHFQSQPIIPTVRTIKDFEDLMHRDFPYLIVLESHIGQLPGLLQLARKHDKKVILHADLVQGLRNDEYGAQFLCQWVKPDGIISTHSSVITTARKKGLVAIQRVFLLDSHSLETSYRILQTSRPDYIEVLPGVIPHVIHEIRERTHLPILAGGFIRTQTDIETILQSGATAVTTSSKNLWDLAKTHDFRA
ncbi:MAG: glycerol-3-phosphate responsive antiterminator GlpP [Alicyclobacillus sp. RIFOXYA1_FULL_53_8]|nr:MAG: glycerol-3-phosphate responsive antiterminator GlpP [Alicyclobacillus sp. RIFOXYA1_FULL_53_8]